MTEVTKKCPMKKYTETWQKPDGIDAKEEFFADCIGEECAWFYTGNDGESCAIPHLANLPGIIHNKGRNNYE